MRTTRVLVMVAALAACKGKGNDGKAVQTGSAAGSAAAVSVDHPVTKVDGRLVGNGQPGPITRQLIEAFHKHVRGQL